MFVLKQKKLRNEKMQFAFIDLRMALNRVARTKFWQILEEKGYI